MPKFYDMSIYLYLCVRIKLVSSYVFIMYMLNSLFKLKGFKLEKSASLNNAQQHVVVF